MINVRSPFFVSVSGAGLQSCLLDIYIYEGTQTTDRPVNPTYSVETTSINSRIDFEISELIKDYLEVFFTGTYISQAVWVDYQTTRTVSNVVQTPDAIVQDYALAGYGYFKEGVNPQNTNKLLSSVTTMYVLSGQPVIIPVNQELLTEADFFSNGANVGTQSFFSSDESTSIIRYITTTDNAYIFQDNEQYLFQDGEIFVFSFGAAGSGVDRVVLTYSDMTTQTVIIRYVDQCKYNPLKTTFVNKYGALQDLWFYGRNIFGQSVERTMYKANIISSGSYTPFEHQMKSLDVNGEQTITLNSNYYPESHNEIFREMMLSEKVWLFIDDEPCPINITSSDIQFKNQAGDKLISYTINAKFANDTVQNVR